jgi:heme-degrading monooxygenase HmoA
MISRIWHGWTTPGNADRYEQLLRTEILPEIASRGIAGYLGAHLLRKENDAEVEFVTILWFGSLDSVRAFMGEDYEAAHVPPRARAVLSRFDERSCHYDVLLEP